MKRILLSIALLTSGMTFAQNSVSTYGSDAWTGWVNSFDLSMNYQFGTAWGVADLKTTLNVSPSEQVILQPNFNAYADNSTDPTWVDQTTGAGQRIFEASTYVEPGATFNGQDLTFTGNVTSNTLDAGYTAKYFIKALDPANNYADALNGAYVMDIPASGDFTVTVTGAELTAGLIVQYGFSILGVVANPADEQTLGSIIIEPSTIGFGELEVNNVSVYPNPTSEILNIANATDFDSYSIVSLDGKTVSEGSVKNSIEVSALIEGVYLINLIDKAGNSTTKRFIKK
ncbi:MAG: T9SS type A sorting domain-containing protein [Crocinitomicaceae bacterium]